MREKRNERVRRRRKERFMIMQARLTDPTIFRQGGKGMQTVLISKDKKNIQMNLFDFLKYFQSFEKGNHSCGESCRPLVFCILRILLDQACLVN